MKYFYKNGESENELHKEHVVSMCKSCNLKHECDDMMTESSAEVDYSIYDNIYKIHLIYRPMIITSFFNLSYVWNRGITFGIFHTHNHDSSHLLIICVSVVGILYFLYLARHFVDKHKDVKLGCELIIGGAIANIIDRIKFGAVFDFLDFHAFGYHYPSFNIADSAIVIGVILVYCILYKSKKT